MVGFTQLAAIGVALAGEQVAQALGIAVPPEILGALRERRGIIIMGAWYASVF